MSTTAKNKISSTSNINDLTENITKQANKKFTQNKKVIGAFLGTMIEYYDYSLYTFSIAILALNFFPQVETIQALKNIFAIYALGYVAKPIGGLVFSYLGDRYGRKFSLRITVIGIAFPTFIIGILPTYEIIGPAGGVILIGCKFLQGFFTGGEYDGAAIYAIEHFGKDKKYFASAITRASGGMGLLLAVLSIAFFNSSLFDFISWSWRIPFLLSLPLAMIVIYYRKFLEETPDFIKYQEEQKINKKANKSQQDSILNFILNNKLNLLITIIVAGGFGVTYQISIVLMKPYLSLIMPELKPIINYFFILIVFYFGIGMILSGVLANKIGHMKIIFYGAVLAIIALILILISYYQYNILLMLFAVSLLAIGVSPFNALAHAFISGLYATKYRYKGINIGHTIGSVLMSGTANLLSMHMISSYNIILFPFIYVFCFIIITVFILRFIDSKVN